MSEKSFLFVDANDEALQTRPGAKFGLNTGVVELFQFVEDAGKDGAPANAVDIHVKSGDSKPVRLRLYVDQSTLYGKGNLQVQPGEEGYDDLYYADMTQKVAVIKQTLHALEIGDDKIKTVLNANDVIGSIKAMVNLVPAGYNKKEVDFFLEWQWQPGKDQERTYLEFPKNVKGGRIITKAQKPVGKWKEVVNEDGLSYVDDAGNKHIISRTEDFIMSPKGFAQKYQGADLVPMDPIPSWKSKSSSASEPKSDTAKSAAW